MAETNIIKTPDLGNAVDARTIDFVEQFSDKVTRLKELLNLTNVINVKNGKIQTSKFTVTPPSGDAGKGIVPEGDDIPLTHVKKEPGREIVVPLRKYRKAVTVEEVNRVGYETAVLRTDKAAMDKISKDVRGDFMTFFATDAVDKGTATNLQQAFGKMWGEVQNAFDGDGKATVFINPLDAGTYLGSAAIENGQSVGFGLTLLTGFTNVNVIIQNTVPQGVIYGTSEGNLNLGKIDLNSDVRQMFNDKPQYTDENGFILAVQESQTRNATSESLLLTGLALFAEVTNGVFKITLAPVA